MIGESMQRNIIVRGEKYAYAGDIPNKESLKKDSIIFNRTQGKKTAFRKYKNENELAVYISIKSFESLLKKYGRY